MKTKLLALLISISSIAAADQEAHPIFYMVANGAWYAKCIPSGSYQNREEGTTRIYLADRDSDKLIYTFDWYSPEIYITGWGGGVSIVRMGPWPRGDKVTSNDLAVAFYHDGELLRRYSTLDIVGEENSVSISVSHYTAFKEVIGFVHIYEKRGRDTLTSNPGYGFEVVLHDDRHIVFDPKTGNKVLLGFNIFTRRAN